MDNTVIITLLVSELSQNLISCIESNIPEEIDEDSFPAMIRY